MLSVLIVEDEATLANAICYFVDAAIPEARCIQMPTGADAISFLLSNAGKEIRLVIVDLNLRDMSGRAVIQRVFADRKDLRGRLVVCSGETLADDDPLFVAFGCERLDKPFEIERLQAILEKACA